MHEATEARVVNKAEAATGYAHCTWLTTELWFLIVIDHD